MGPRTFTRGHDQTKVLVSELRACLREKKTRTCTRRCASHKRGEVREKKRETLVPRAITMRWAATRKRGSGGSWWALLLTFAKNKPVQSTRFPTHARKSKRNMANLILLFDLACFHRYMCVMRPNAAYVCPVQASNRAHFPRCAVHFAPFVENTRASILA